MTTLAELHVHDLASARIRRRLIRYRVLIHVAVLLLAVALASADRRPTSTTQASLLPLLPATHATVVDDRPLVLPDR